MASQKRLAETILEPIISFWNLFKKQTRKATNQKPSYNNSPKASFTSNKPKQLLAMISNKTINLRHKKKKKKAGAIIDENEEHEARHGFGDGGLWQRSIMMGDKCQPLDFSGVIYYDHDGKRVSELPIRSPRASPLPRYIYGNN
ncbi:hypothetical protein Leryth_005777 [Lithospermum erythrorhizon]|nr:hypothetical protein Leryth_005777 [Lithospermum erythrorhizon]